MPADIVITGLGLVTPAGRTASETWHALLAATRCVQPLGILRADGRTHLGGRLAPISQPVDSVSSNNRDVAAAAAAAASVASLVTTGQAGPQSAALIARGTPMDPVCAMALTAAREAFDQAGSVSREWAVSIGTSKGGIDSLTALYDICVYRSRKQYKELIGGHTLSALLYNAMPDGAARQVAAGLGLTGPVTVPVAACATGTLAVIAAARLIADGRMSAALAGGSDASLNPLWLAAFGRMAVLADEHPALGPGYACRPFDASRRGFVPGEGAGVLALESSASARARRVEPLARILGWSCGSDPAGLTAGSPDGSTLAGVVLRACVRAGVDPGDLAAIVAHGTGTPANDVAEIRGLRAVLGDRLAEVPLVSIKGSLGHLLGAAGAVELAVAAMMCRERVCPPNATLCEPDPALGRLCLPIRPLAINAGPILKTSSGFGGHVAAVILGSGRKVTGDRLQDNVGRHGRRPRGIGPPTGIIDVP